VPLGAQLSSLAGTLPIKGSVRSNRQEAVAAGKRLAVIFGFVLVAFVAGSATHSVNVFVGVMGLGVAVGIGLRLRRAFH
jgi:hypothetical protein